MINIDNNTKLGISSVIYMLLTTIMISIIFKLYYTHHWFWLNMHVQSIRDDDT